MTTEVTRLQACIEPELPTRRLQGDGDGDGDGMEVGVWGGWKQWFILWKDGGVGSWFCFTSQYCIGFSPPKKRHLFHSCLADHFFFWSPLRRARMRQRWWSSTLRLFQQRSCVMSTQRSALDVSNWACMDIPGDRTGSKMWQQQGRTMYFTAGGFAFKAEAGTSTKSWAVKARQLRICKVGMTFQFFSNPQASHLCVVHGINTFKGLDGTFQVWWTPMRMLRSLISNRTGRFCAPGTCQIFFPEMIWKEEVSI